MPHRNSHWFKGPEGRDQAINYDGNDGGDIYKLLVNNAEENLFFRENGIGYRISPKGYEFLKRRIERFTIEEFQDLCNDPSTSRII